MLTERLKQRLSKDRPTTSITLSIPVDVVESMKTLAPLRGFAGYQTLLKLYISEGLCRDEERFASGTAAGLTEAFDLLASLPDDFMAEGRNDSWPEDVRAGLWQDVERKE